MKRFLFAFILVLAVWSPLAAQTTTDTLLFAPLTSAVSTKTFILTYPSEISVLWDRWAAIGAQVDTVWFERYDANSATWIKLRLYKEQTGEYDTILVKDRPISIAVPIHAVPVKVRMATGGRQVDTVKVQWRW